MLCPKLQLCRMCLLSHCPISCLTGFSLFTWKSKMHTNAQVLPWRICFFQTAHLLLKCWKLQCKASKLLAPCILGYDGCVALTNCQKYLYIHSLHLNYWYFDVLYISAGSFCVRWTHLAFLYFSDACWTVYCGTLMLLGLFVCCCLLFFLAFCPFQKFSLNTQTKQVIWIWKRETYVK